jgi:hypothetical protein
MPLPSAALPRIVLPRLVLSMGLLAALAPLNALADKPIEQDMTPEEFKAAGLDKLTSDELAKLNTWLGRKIETATTAAAKQAKQKVEDENRGFLNFGSMEPIVSKVVGEFKGFGKGREYVLENGQHWRQTDEATLVGARLSNPEVRINPSIAGNAWYMAVKGYNTRAKVERIK